VDKGDRSKGPRLVSSAAKAGKPGAVYIAFPYWHFEDSLLAWGRKLRLGDVVPKKASNVEEKLRQAEGKVADLDHRVETVQRKIATAGNLDVLLDTLVDLEEKRREAHQTVERLKRELTTQAGDALSKTRELIERSRAATEEEEYDLRIKLRSTLKRFIQDIVVLVIQANGDRVALADVRLRSGKRMRVTIMPGKPVTLPDGLDGRDVREWRRWPKKLREMRFDVVSAEVRRMIELEDAGHTRSEIAEKLGVSRTRVSRSLVAQGRRKQKRKPAGGDRLMTWHPQGRGWVKRHKGERYFIGVGRLKTLYPRLVKGKTEKGTCRAANRWWQEQLAALGKGGPARGT